MIAPPNEIENKRTIDIKEAVFEASTPGLKVIAKLFINNKMRLEVKSPLYPTAPANNSSINEIIMAGVNAVTAKNKLVSDNKTEVEIPILDIEFPFLTIAAENEDYNIYIPL